MKEIFVIVRDYNNSRIVIRFFHLYPCLLSSKLTTGQLQKWLNCKYLHPLNKIETSAATVVTYFKIVCSSDGQIKVSCFIKVRCRYQVLEGAVLIKMEAVVRLVWRSRILVVYKLITFMDNFWDDKLHQEE